MAQVFDVAVDHALITKEIVAPKLCQQHFPRKYPSRAGDQSLQQLKLAHSEIQRTPIQNSLHAIEIQRQIPITQQTIFFASA